MQATMKLMVQELVDDRDSVSVEYREYDDHDSYIIRADREDIGKIIGRNGRMMQAIKTWAYAVASKSKRTIMIQAKENTDTNRIESV